MTKHILLIGVILSALAAINPAHSADSIQAEGQLENAFSSWGKASIEGDWKIVTDENGQRFIELAENFKAKEGPDVKIFFSPLASESINGKNAVDGSVFVYQLDDFEGANRIQIPENLNLSEFKTLVFHCEAYSKLWGVSAL